MNNNPSLISQIQKYFTTGPQVILLPVLQWDYAQMPDFNEEGFYLDYNHIQAAHPPLRDRMMYGLNKIAFSINAGVSEEESYFIKCKNFENLIENVYNGKLNISVALSTNTFTKQRPRTLLILVILTMSGSYRKLPENLRIM